MYTYTHMYIHIYIYIYTHIHIHVCMHIYIYIYTYYCRQAICCFLRCSVFSYVRVCFMRGGHRPTIPAARLFFVCRMFVYVFVHLGVFICLVVLSSSMSEVGCGDHFLGSLDSLRGSSVRIGTMQSRFSLAPAQG